LGKITEVDFVLIHHFSPSHYTKDSNFKGPVSSALLRMRLSRAFYWVF
jgi:hypothetical protein